MTSGRYIIIGLLLCAATAVHAQQPVTRIDKLPLSKPWLNTENAAGWGGSELPASARSYGRGQWTQGDFHRAQQPESSRQLHFFSEGIKSIGKGMIYGSFHYNRQEDINIQLADVIDPYRGTPYLLTDSVGGDWKKQLYSMQVKAATGPILNRHVHLGIGISYKTATGARQNDPRPLNNVNEIHVMPAITWQPSKKHTIGLNGFYGAFQESVSLQNKNTDRNQHLYKLLGMGQYALPSILSVSASRRYKGDRYGGNVQYSWQHRQWQILADVGYSNYREVATDGSIPPLKGGTLEETVVTGMVTALHNRHRLTLNYAQYDRIGIETQYARDLNNNTWTVTLEAPFTTSYIQTGKVSYDYITTGYTWMLHGDITYHDQQNKYLQPASSQQISNLTYTLSAGKRFPVKKNNSIEATVCGAYMQNIQQELNYLLMTTTTNLIAYKVLYPDHAYQTADAVRTGASLQYNFSHKEVPRVQFFIQGSTHLHVPLSTGTTGYELHGNRNSIMFTIGAFY